MVVKESRKRPFTRTRVVIEVGTLTTFWQALWRLPTEIVLASSLHFDVHAVF
jgi:hypothetical protein